MWQSEKVALICKTHQKKCELKISKVGAIYEHIVNKFISEYIILCNPNVN